MDGSILIAIVMFLLFPAAFGERFAVLVKAYREEMKKPKKKEN
jgi:hypothetical protein